ncbi:MAG: hemolysin III family protein [Oscillospiraceae bacterium]|nr:hemolysin III family protein [Oscillospiraceae bacterium]
MMRQEVELIEYSRGVDRANCMTHAAAAVLSVVGGALLFMKAEGFRQMFSSVIYSLAMIAVYTVSAVYHGLPPGERKRKARLADHCTVPVLIAGTATPCALVTLYELSIPHSLVVLILGWGCTTFGIITRIFFFQKLKGVTMAVYILSGAVMLFSAVPLLGQISREGFAELCIGCVFYLVGAALMGLGRKKEWLHVIFHVFVVIGSAVHFHAVLTYVLG